MYGLAGAGSSVEVNILNQTLIAGHASVITSCVICVVYVRDSGGGLEQ